LLLGLAGTLAVGVAVELVALRTLYERDHLDQVLATFGLILFFNELAAMIWGRAALYTTIPEYLSGHVDLLPGLRYPLYRLVIMRSAFASRASCGSWSRKHAWDASSARALPTAPWWRRSASTCACCIRWCSASAPRSPASPGSWRGRSTWCSRGWAS